MLLIVKSFEILPKHSGYGFIFVLEIFTILYWLFGYVEKRMIRKLSFISKFMTSKTVQKIITIHILSNTSRIKVNEEIKFDQLTKYNMRNGKQIVTIHILSNILRSTVKEEIKLGQLTKSNLRIIFFKKRCRKWVVVSSGFKFRCFEQIVPWYSGKVLSVDSLINSYVT